MAYEPTNWENREVEKPRTYTMVDNADGTITLQPAEGTVFVEGTPIIADNMNKIENQLVAQEQNLQAYEHATLHATDALTYVTDGTADDYKPVYFHVNPELSEGLELDWPQYDGTTGELTMCRGVKIKEGAAGYYLMTCSVTLEELPATDAYAILLVQTGLGEFELDRKHISAINSSITLNGSIIMNMVATAYFNLRVTCTEDYAIKTNARSSAPSGAFMTVQKLN